MAYAKQQELMNTATLDMVPIFSSLVVIATTSKGQIYQIKSNLTCSSSDTGSLQISPDCTQIFLNGSETRGSDGTVFVTIVYLNNTVRSLTVTVFFRIWIPQLPIFLEVEDSTLHKIRTWETLRDGVCSSRFQETRVRAFCNFSCGTISGNHAIDVTALVQNSIISTNPLVADFKNKPNSSFDIIGYMPGIIRIMVVLNNVNVSNYVSISVLDEEVFVERLQLTLIESLIIDFATNFSGNFSNNNISHTNTVGVITTVIEKALFVIESERTYIHARILFSDG